MKVNAWKELTVEFEADVEFSDVLTEFSQRTDEATADYWRRLMPALDWMTRILASVKPEVIEAMPESARETMCERLMTEAARYDPAI